MSNFKNFIAAVLLASLSTQSVHAQAVTPAKDWPNRTIRWVLPYPAGGTSDVLTRLLAQQLSIRLGQQVIVDNRPGANGLIGTDIVAKAAPDGYTMVVGVIGPLAVLSHMVKMQFDPVKDLAPVTLLASVANVVVVRKDAPYKTLTELIESARARPEQVTFGSVGVGSSGQLSAGLLGGMAGVKLSNIGYAGGSPAMMDLLGGRLDLMFDNAPTSAPRVRSGELRALAITSARRSLVMPDVSTVAELGYAGYEAGSWFGALVPAGTPRPIIQRLNQELVAILRDPVLSEQLTKQMFELKPSTPEEFAAFIRSESSKWAKVIKDNNIKASE